MDDVSSLSDQEETFPKMPMPDADIHPTATGKALETVKQHQKEEDLVFYSGWFCPFVQRVWLALEERNIKYQYKEENPYHKDKEFLEVSPRGLVPAIKHHGKPLNESQVILEFLEDAYPDHKPHLRPRDPYLAAKMRLAVDHISKTFIPAFFSCLQAQEADKQKAGLNDVVSSLNHFGSQVQGPYWAGQDLTFADLVLVPFAARLYILQDHRGLTDDMMNEGFKNWKKVMLQRDSVVRTLSDERHYVEIYGRYLRNEAQSEMAKGTRAGTGEP